jgi:cation:H+ antiporter
MDIIIAMVLLVIGVGILVKGSDLLVDSATSIALALGASITIIGLSVVAFGTSLPELVVGVSSSLEGAGEIALGDVIGANIANICLIIGAAAIIRPIVISPDSYREDIPVTIAATLLLLILSLDGMLDFKDGFILMAGMLAYIFWLYLKAKNKDKNSIEGKRKKASNKDYILLILGTGMALLGGKLTVDSAIIMAEFAGISQYLIGITVIAIGTALPELTTAVFSSLKNKGELALGNSLGSVCINTMLILGIAALINPIPVYQPQDIAIVAIITIILLPLVIRGNVLAKWEGMFLIIFYFIYISLKVIGV